MIIMMILSNLLSRYSKKLGEQLADLHLHNKKQMEKQEREQQTVGNLTSTCTGMQILTTHIVFLLLLLFDF